MSTIDLKIYLIDDDEGIRSSLVRALSKRGYAIDAFESAADFLAIFDKTQHGCLLLDYGMPDMNGLELQQHLNKIGSTIPIIFITGHGGIPESVAAMKAGATDFLEKPFRQDTLLACIDRAFERETQQVKVNTQLQGIRERSENLTNRERQVAEFIVANPASTSSKDVARALDISPRTVDHHRASIMDKMQVKSVAELIEVSVRLGLFKAP